MELNFCLLMILCVALLCLNAWLSTKQKPAPGRSRRHLSRRARTASLRAHADPKRMLALS